MASDTKKVTKSVAKGGEKKALPKEVLLSGLIVTTNEELMIEDALKSLSFCDEIVVVLDKVTDGTEKIAKKYADKVIKGSWDIEGERRNLGIEACNGEWIVEIDADERIATPLAKEIIHFTKHAPFGYVLLPVQNYVGKNYVEYGWAGSFGTTKAKKLFAKGAKIWGQQRVHPQLTLNGESMEIGTTLGAGEGIIHLIDTDINDMIDRMQRYSDWLASDMIETGKIPHFATTLRKALTRFYKSYFARKGYKSGKWGFLLALMAGLMFIFAHLKAELEKNNKNNG